MNLHSVTPESDFTPRHGRVCQAPYLTFTWAHVWKIPHQMLTLTVILGDGFCGTTRSTWMQRASWANPQTRLEGGQALTKKTLQRPGLPICELQMPGCKSQLAQNSHLLIKFIYFNFFIHIYMHHQLSNAYWAKIKSKPAQRKVFPILNKLPNKEY